MWLSLLMVGDKDNRANVLSNKRLLHQSWIWLRLILSDEHVVTEMLGVGGYLELLVIDLGGMKGMGEVIKVPKLPYKGLTALTA